MGQNGRVVVTRVAARAVPDRSRLLVGAGVLAAGLTLSAVYATTGVGVPCPFLALTGWSCPLCGGTRMGSALLHGDLSAAFAFNPLALIGVAVLAVLTALWGVAAAGGPAVRPPRAAGRVGRPGRRHALAGHRTGRGDRLRGAPQPALSAFLLANRLSPPSARAVERAAAGNCPDLLALIDRRTYGIYI